MTKDEDGRRTAVLLSLCCHTTPGTASLHSKMGKVEIQEDIQDTVWDRISSSPGMTSGKLSTLPHKQGTYWKGLEQTVQQI